MSLFRQTSNIESNSGPNCLLKIHLVYVQGECEVFIPATPTCPTQFSKAWLLHVLDDWFTQQGVDTSQVDIVDIAAARNGLQAQSCWNPN